MTAVLVDESVICHDDSFEIERGRAPQVEFRVLIHFQDEDGNEWSIDKCFVAAPRKS